jgi:hypothetical protein
MPRHACEFEDEALLRECRVETYRASGPGGQKRNKTSSAVRITHVPTGVVATAADSRSQHDNRRRGMERLRLQLALEVRREVEGETVLPEWWGEVTDRSGRLQIGRRAARYVPAMAVIFDVLEAQGASVADAAAALGTSTANLVEFLAADPHAWAALQRMRQVHGHRTLLNPRRS